MDRTCSVDGCDRKHRALGYCSMHHQRVRKTGETGEALALREHGRICSVAGCERKNDCYGMCGMHFHRVRVHGQPGGAESLRPGGTCGVDGCELPLRLLKMCDAHYKQKRDGKPFTPVRKSWRGKVMERDAEGRKQCRNCEEWFDPGVFHKSTKNKDGLGQSCLQCRRNRNVQLRYGISAARYDAILEAQGGGCAICQGVNENGNAMAIDHDHACCPGARACGRCVRGLLCSRCNTGIGQFRDEISYLEAAINYLKNRQIVGVNLDQP